MTNPQNPYLIVRRGPNPDQTFDLSEETCIAGREPINDVVLADPEVSRRHARLVLRNGAYHIEDLSSTNGTYINGRRISSLTPLAHGDVIDFGETIRVVFHWPSDQVATIVANDRLKSVPQTYTDSAIFDTSTPFPVPQRKATSPISEPALSINDIDTIDEDSYIDEEAYADAETITELPGPSLSPMSNSAESLPSEPAFSSTETSSYDNDASPDTPSRRNLWIGVGCGVVALGLCSCGSIIFYLDAYYPETLYGLWPF